MGDFTDKLALGTSRMNPASMVPGSTGNAPQAGVGTQLKRPALQPGQQTAALAAQLSQGVKPLQMPAQPQSDLPTSTQQMLPNKSEKKTSYKKEDFQLLSDVFKTLSER